MPEKIVEKVQFVCEICNEKYPTLEEAEKCEDQGYPKFKFHIGDTFVVSNKGVGEPNEPQDTLRVIATGPCRGNHKPDYRVEKTEKNRCPHCQKEIRSSTIYCWHEWDGITEEELEKLIIKKLD